MWNASRFCVSSLRRGHANLLCIVPILVYVLPKQVRLKLFVGCIYTYKSQIMRLTGRRYVIFIGTFVGLIGTHVYINMISPMMNPEPYKRIREQIQEQYRDRKK